jgi:hypothetical protein
MNTKMKVLALALLGLAGYAGSAVAGGCPASPVPPWTAAPALGGTVVIASGGLDGSPCRMDSALIGDSSSFATVEDDTPSAEPRYRASFIINADNVSSMSATTASFVFTASGASGRSPVALSIVGDGAGNVYLSYFVVNGTTVLGGSKQLTAGPNHVEFDYDNGNSPNSAGPHFSLWINSNTEGSPTFTTAIANTTAVVETAFLGLAGATGDWGVTFNGTTVGFDTFDSRRSTFIGY